jgi:hypothetical protein
MALRKCFSTSCAVKGIKGLPFLERERPEVMYENPGRTFSVWASSVSGFCQAVGSGVAKMIKAPQTIARAPWVRRQAFEGLGTSTFLKFDGPIMSLVV